MEVYVIEWQYGGMTDQEIAQIIATILEKQCNLQEWEDTFCIRFGGNAYGHLTRIGGAMYVHLSTDRELDKWSNEHKDDYFGVIDDIEGITAWIRENTD